MNRHSRAARRRAAASSRQLATARGAQKIQRRRPRAFEVLEARQLLARDLWHNPLWPLDAVVDQYGVVAPIDALVIINELNDPVYSDPHTHRLPDSLPGNAPVPYYLDVSCDGIASPIDALLVINELNEPTGAPGWSFASDGGSGNGAGRVDSFSCAPRLVEGNSFQTELRVPLTAPATPSSVRVTFDPPQFDSSSTDTIRDAFEIVVQDMNGQPLALPVTVGRDASFNSTEGLAAMTAPGTTSTSTSVTINVSTLPAGTPLQVVARLVNNDADDTTSVVLRGVDFVPTANPPPTGGVPVVQRQSATSLDLSNLVDVTPGLVPVYGRTTLADDQHLLAAEFSVRNDGAVALTGPLLVAIDNLSDPAVMPIEPDGRLPDGRPYWNLSTGDANETLAQGETSVSRVLQFRNPSQQRFTFQWQALGDFNVGPTPFTSTPLRQIEVDHAYRYVASAEDPEGEQLSYALVSGPEGMSIDAATGAVTWLPIAGDVGDHGITLRVSDPYGLSSEQTFTLSVLADLQNRPPTFVSDPETAATVAGAFDVVTVGVGAQPTGLAAGNFGSGHLSLIAASQGTQTVTLSPGLGQERFGEPRAVNIGEPPPSADVLLGGIDVNLGLPAIASTADENGVGDFDQGDFNGDGILDFATSIYLAYRLPDYNMARQRALAINLGRGDGTFAPALHLAVAGPAPVSRDAILTSLVARDLDGDGILDLLALDNVTNDFHFFLGLGQGQFAADQIMASGVNASSYRVADLNRDGADDLVVLTDTQDELGFMRGRGDGTFQAFQQIARRPGAGYYHNDYAIGDLNDDGWPDLAAGDWNGGRIDLFFNDAAGGFAGTSNWPALEPYYPYPGTPGTSQPSLVMIGDFTGDGHGDLLYGVNATNLRGGGFGLYRGDGSGTSFTFQNAAVYLPGRPINMATSASPVDLNGDGRLDFVATGSSASGYGVVAGINRGDGTFDARVYENATSGVAPTGSNTFFELGALAGDHDGDGWLDLAIAASSQLYQRAHSGVSVLRAESPGNYLAPHNVSVNIPQAPVYVSIAFAQAGDFNNDGFADLWAAGYQSTSITLLGNGDGSFQPARTATPYIGNEFLSPGFTADFNRDGNLDIFWLGGGGVQGGPTGRYLAALGNGDGSFQITFAQTVPGKFYGANVAAPADFNGDGYIDFVARGGGGPFIDVWLNVPSQPGTFAQSVRHLLPAEGSTNAMVVGDFDGDSVPDIAAISRADGNLSQRWLYVLHGVGDGTFTELPAVPVFQNTDLVDPYWMATGDLNHDGHLDLVTTAAYSRSAVMLGRGDGTFERPTVYVSGTYFASRRNLYLVDMNADGDLDLVTVNDNTSRGSINIRLGLGDGSFGEQRSYDGGDIAGVLTIADFDNDGYVDLGMTAANAYYAETIFPGVRPGLTAVATGDLDGDGFLDALALNNLNNRLKVLLGRDDETFSRQQDVLVDLGPVALAVGDVNEDGRLDVVTANRAGQSLSVLVGTGGGRFTRADVPVGRAPVDVALRDITSDGHADLLVVDEVDQALTILIGDGLGAWAAPLIVPLGDRPERIAVGDWSGDGKLDLAVTLPATRRIMLLDGDGTGSFGAPRYVVLSSQPGDIAGEDLNLDGKRDLVVTLPDENRTAIYFGLGAGRFSAPQTIAVGARPIAVDIQDADGDGRADILVSNQGDNTASVILNHFDPSRIYRYPALAVDPDDDPVTYEMVLGPEGMLIDSATGQIAWAPSSDQVGIHAVTLRAADDRGGTSTQSFQVAVSPPKDNSAPVWTSLPASTIASTSVFHYESHAGDSDGDAPRYRLLEAPAGATIDPRSGDLNWDPRGVALSMNAGTDNGQVTIPSSPSLEVTSVTVEGWFRFSRAPLVQRLITKANANSGSFGLQAAYGNLQGVIGNGSVEDVVSVPWNPVIGQWYHLAFTFDETTKRMALLIDGQDVQSKTTTASMAPSGQPLYMGWAYPFTGSLADIRIWNQARSTEQINATMGRSVAPDAPGLVADYRFQEGDAQSVFDSSINGNHGRLDGSWWPTRVPGFAPVQTGRFRISAEDGRGGVVEQAFDVQVVDPRTGSMAGLLFEDRSGDGARQNDEPTVADALVFLDENANGFPDANERFARTNATGGYRLDGLLAGEYSLAVEPLAGYAPAPVARVAVEAVRTTQHDLSLTPQALSQIRGRVALDLDDDGLVREEQPLYSADFASPDVDLAPWSPSTITTSPNGQKFLGRFSTEVVTLNLGDAANPLPPHDSLTLSFDLLVIDSWDGNNTSSGPDRLRFRLDGREFLFSSFSNTSNRQSYPGSYPTGDFAARTGAVGSNTLGYTYFGDTTYRVTFHLPHVGSTARFEFQGIGLQGVGDESWGLNQVQVTAPEPLAARWQVFADLDRDGFLDAEEPAAPTDARGDYALSGLPAGEYDVRVAAPSGWRITQPATGVRPVTLAAGSVSNGNDFVAAPFDLNRPAPPEFATRPPLTAVARGSYRYAAVALDPNFHAVTYALAVAPMGMVVDPRTGAAAWSPTIEQLGPQRVVLQARNDRGGIASQEFVIEVTPPNSAPIITSDAPARAFIGETYQYDLHAQDAEDSTLTYSFVVHPAGAAIDATTGRITWTPTLVQIDLPLFTVEARDSAGAFARQTFTPDVLMPLVSIPFVVTAPRATAAVNQTYRGRMVGVDALGRPLAATLLSGPAGLSVAPSGEVTWQPSLAQLGPRLFTVRLVGPSGDLEDRQFEIDVLQSVANVPPRIVSSPPRWATVGRMFAYDVTALDADNDQLAYELLAGPIGMSIDPTRGALAWLPQRDQSGPVEVSVRVVDPLAGEVTQAFTVTTRLVGGPPVITSIPPTEGVAGQTYLYPVEAVDPEHDPLTYSLLTGPIGMTIDANSGDVNWTPALADVGLHPVIVEVRDGLGGAATQAFALRVAAGAPNQPPVISTTPRLAGTVGTAYSYQLLATDPEGQVVHYEVRRGPVGLAIDPDSGQVSWTPAGNQTGRAAVTLVARDAQGAAAVQSFAIDVLAVNHAPQITSRAPAMVPAGGVFRYDVVARDVDVDPLRFELVGPPPGMTVDPFGRIRWTTTTADVGHQAFTIRVVDARGGVDTQDVELDVVPDTTAPRVTVLPTTGGWPWDGPIVVFVSAVDNVGVTSLELLVNNIPVPLDSNRTARLHYADWGSGILHMTATARDAAGNIGTGTGISLYRNPDIDYEANPAVPEAVVTSPGEANAVGGFVTITGTASGPDFKEYRLSYRRSDQNSFTEFVHAATAVEDGVLGVWDTSLLENDSYVLRLEATDEIGSSSVVDVPVGVSGNVKLGNFRTSFTDMTIRVGSIPVTITRTYDTLRADREGDYGFGWRLEYRDVDLRTSLPRSGLEDLGIYTAFRQGTKVYVTLPGGEREGFTFTPDVRTIGSSFGSLTFAVPRFTPDRGVTTRLSVRGGTLLVNEFGELMGSSGQPYNPAAEEFGGGYTLTTAEGVAYRVDGATGLLSSATDRNHNSIAFTEAGISGSGVNLTFERDARGRITRAIDPVGNSIQYGYDARGDLVRVVDRDGHATQFQYRTDRPHYLEKVIDPLGRTGLRTEYGSDGRLRGVLDLQGHAVEYSYDPGQSLVTTTDRLGHSSVTGYDERGNVVLSIDAMGNMTRLGYDEAGNVASQTDALGNTTRWTYDDAGRVLSETDALGYTTFTTYGRYGSPASFTSAGGDTWTLTLDERGNPTGSIDPLGNAQHYVLDERGSPVRVRDSLGQETDLAYDGAGRLVQTTSALGELLQYGYDATGNFMSQASAGAQPITFSYSAGGAVASVTTSGQTTQLMTDAAGRLVGGGIGSAIGTVVYDSGDRLQSLTLAGGTTVGTRQYDAEGNVVAEADTLGNVTTHRYDALNRRIESTHPSGAVESWQYDALGRVVRYIDARGGTTINQYDAVGQLVRQVDAAGGVTTLAYDPDGRLLALTDPDGTVTGHAYDGRGLETQVTFADGGIQATVHDALGRRIRDIDPRGGVTHYQYDAVGNLVAIIDPTGATTRYEYSAGARVTRIIDPLGRTTEFDYDANGRQVGITYPTGQTREFEYNSLGQVVRDTNGGRAVEFTYGGDGMLIGLRDDLGNTESYAHTPDFQVSTIVDTRGTTQYTYDPLTRQLLRVTEPDGRYVRNEYNAAGDRTLVATGRNSEPESVTRYQYDGLGRVSSMIDPAGGATTFSYTATGGIERIARPNGTTTDYDYDARQRVVEVVDVSAGGILLAQWRYTYDLAGNRTRVVALDGSRVDYKYDAANRVVAERSYGPTSLLVGQTTYAYNAAGDMVSRTGTLGNATFAYSSAGQLLSGDGKSYTYDSAGNVATVTDSLGVATTMQFDARGRLLRVQRTGDAASVFEYDAQGNRVATTSGSVRTDYWVDRQPGELARVLRAQQGADTIQVVHQGAVEQEIINGVSAYVHRDALGSARLLTDSAGAPRARLDYSAFGQTTSELGTPGMFRFAGEQFDSATGLYNLRARHYDPTTGRFVSRDPAQGDFFTLDGFAGYQYARDNPVNLTDPSGRMTLAETLTVVRERLQQYKTDILRYKKAMDTVTTRIGEVAQYVGGAMATVAVFFPPHNITWALYTFGPKFFTGMINTVDVARDMLGGANASYEISFGYNVTTGKKAVAYYNRGLSEAQHNLGNKRFARFGLAPTFAFLGLGGAIRPMIPTGGLFGEPSMAGIMVHEFSHFTLNTNDADYLCQNVAYARPTRGLASNVFTSDESIKNADNYRCYARAVTLAFERLAAELLL